MVLFIIIGMALATIIPRIIPVFIVNKLMFKEWVNNWLRAIPYAALGALIFPGILSVIDGKPHIGILGGIVAVILAYVGLNVVIVVVGAIATVFLLTM
ncbi:MAG TPA: AzlD domain-containing protein [Candidatus Pseudogracilibacillus intestinigallinarum]|uniref:AzlD domain-containing protein n=1 Tax=Candidatus Pseudogracilibacillus intestinigallinarum TaxID=2838742 RepID=A0A9D1PNF4_9BACI|nr:AzlD domain-containing protein [Candidatus Pseudogracilibacillus intestinigallinarum]